MSVPSPFIIPRRLLFNLGFTSAKNIYYQLPSEELISQVVERGEGELSDTGTLVIATTDFTGRNTGVRFIVKDNITASIVDWNKTNQPVEEKYFDLHYNKAIQFLNDKKLWIRDGYIANADYRLCIRVINENPYCNLLACDLFLRPEPNELDNIEIDWHLVQLSNFFADPSKDGVPHKNFLIINFFKRIILTGGIQCTGEMEKEIKSIFNFILSKEH